MFEAAGADALGALHQVFDLVVAECGQGGELGVDGVLRLLQGRRQSARLPLE